ncbi:MAG: hypothetical protein Q9208_000362 [Pyrenodesmia sp. 3 TL-2023]
MTEPEELDEDLFADLYDADEPAAPAPPATQPIPAPEPVEAPAPVSTGPSPNETEQHSNIDGSTIMPDANHDNNYTNGPDERDDSRERWDNNGRGSRMDVAAEQDSSGIGIKEDG